MNNLTSTLVACALLVSSSLAFAEAPQESDSWPALKQTLFGAREIVNDEGTRLELELPGRAADAGTVPLGIRLHPLPGDPQLRKLYLVIDKNPSPVGAIFEFGDRGGGIALETRVRIEDYTWVRVVAERADGSLIGTKRYIKAAGGCSAPAGKTLSERMAGIGRMKWRIDPPQMPGGNTMIALLIRHPNNSGLAMDQLTRLYDPPMFVNNVRITRGNMLVFGAQVDFTISENPAFRFSLPRDGNGDLHAEVSDTDDRHFESTFAVNIPVHD